MQIPLEIWTWIGIGAVFAAAGVVKGAIGFGLPTIAMGLLGLFMPPAHAAAALVIPSFVTNVWQGMTGPGLGSVLSRIAVMLGFVCLGVWAGFAFLPRGGGGARVALGCALALYAIVGLSKVEFRLSPAPHPAIASVVGFTTGLITAATGVFVLPAVPYLQALGFSKDELAQALGLSFTVSTVALAAGLAHEGTLFAAIGWSSLITVAAAVAGMMVGQRVRERMSPAVFRSVFFWSLLVLGCAIAIEGLRDVLR